jgi:hypothetical protein
MTRRKPKRSFSPLIEWPTEEPQLVAVAVEHKVPARTGETRQIEKQLPRSLPQLGKITLH